MNSFRSYLSLTIMICLFYVTTNLFAAVVQVPSDQPTIQSAIDAANDGDTVIVTDGIYSGEGNTNIDFKGKQITVQSQNGPEETIINCLSKPNSRGFIFQNKETNDTVLEGFTIKNGNNTDGGGIFCDVSSPTIKNCIITDNSGGGIFCIVSEANIIDCQISNNRDGNGVLIIEPDTRNGVVIEIPISGPSFINCDISQNKGHGIYCLLHASATITKSTISQNLGRGIFCNSFSGAKITNCIISQNLDGGVECREYSGLTITDSIIKQNTAKNGGGIYCSPTSRLNVIGCVIAENIATESGGGIDSISTFGFVDISYCTITRNSANNRGGGVSARLEGSSFNISKSIIWGNISNGTHPEFFGSGPTVHIISCVLQGGLEGFGEQWAKSIVYKDNIDEDPLFVNAENGNYTLRHASPAKAMGATASREDKQEDEEEKVQSDENFIEDSLSVSAVGKRIIKWADLKRN
ncbi:hypothetical protein F4212_09145 [Candidatus Poribacteria bacterium]|nr:hypothetical protein [Candidatus Poribacteria bacterium]